MAYEDLLKDSSSPLDNKNYFNLTITDLNLNESYPIQFRWKYEDGSFGPWSAVKVITTPGATVPPEADLPAQNVVGGAGFIKVTWNGNSVGGAAATNVDRVDVHITGQSFGDGTKPSGSFKVAGTQTFVAEPGSYTVQLKTYTLNATSAFFSTARIVTVTAVGEIIQSPSLPSGLTATTAPFAISINWAGTYSTGTFTGFRSIDIYATSSDLGSTVTSGISDTNLVGSLTVNNAPNKINIGLDNLRQALSLSTNSDVYNSTIFLYYVAVNKDGTKYGSPTYTRINSSSIVPTKANFVDLASGVISVENLVAGNGTFSSWLRTGAAGGARIELSAINNFTNNGYTVKKGLTAYSSGSTETLGFDLATGALSLSGSLAATSISTSSGKFAVNSSGILTATDVNLTGQISATGGNIGGLIIAADAIQNGSTSGNSTFRLDNTGKARFGLTNSIIIDPATGNIYSSPDGGTSIGNFQINGGNLTLKGQIKATSGFIGTDGAQQWVIGSDGIQASGAARIRIGNYDIKSYGSQGDDFQIYDHLNSISIFRTDDGVSTGIYRIYIGAQGVGGGRQVEVAKNAEISGSYTGSEQDYRSGGLRNMYTISSGQFISNPSPFPNAASGAVLLVYVPS